MIEYGDDKFIFRMLNSVVAINLAVRSCSCLHKNSTGSKKLELMVLLLKGRFVSYKGPPQQVDAWTMSI